MIRFIRRYRYTITLLAICAGIGAWFALGGHIYHGPESWWRLVIAGASGGVASTLARRRR